MAAHVSEAAPAARTFRSTEHGHPTGDWGKLEAAIHASVVRAYAAWTGLADTHMPGAALVPLALVAPTREAGSVRELALQAPPVVREGLRERLRRAVASWRAVPGRAALAKDWVRLRKIAPAAVFVTYAPAWPARERWDRRVMGLGRLALFLVLVFLLLGATAWFLLTAATHAFHHQIRLGSFVYESWRGTAQSMSRR
jgi:hypothetical protein